MCPHYLVAAFYDDLYFPEVMLRGPSWALFSLLRAAHGRFPMFEDGMCAFLGNCIPVGAAVFLPI